MSEPYEPCFSDQNKLHFVLVFTGSTDNGKLKLLTFLTLMIPYIKYLLQLS